MPVKYAGAAGYGAKPAQPTTPRAGRHRAVSAGIQTAAALAKSEVAADLGMAPVPVGLRLNVGHERDASVVRKSFPPETDFECWGWLSKKGGVRRNWLERFFHLNPAGVLTYYENCNTIGVKKGGSTKMRLMGFKEKGSLNLKEVSEIRMGTAENKTPGELELVTEERTFRMRVGRTAGGTKKIEDEPMAAHVWCACLNLALIAALEKESAEQGRDFRDAVQHVKQALQSDPALTRDALGFQIDKAVFDAMSCVNLLHEEIAGGQAARSRFLAAGGSGGGSVFAKDTSGTTVEAPAPEPEPRSDLQPMCTSLYYVDHDGNSSFEVSWQEVGRLVETGEIKPETQVFSEEAAYPFDEWVAWSKASHCFVPKTSE